MDRLDITRLRENTPIIELAESLGLEVKRKQARCYNSQAHAHGDKKPSLGFNTNTNRYKCFACGVSGSVIDLYMAIKGVDLPTAIRELNGGHLSDETNLKPSYSKPKKIVGDYNEIYEKLALFCNGIDKETEKYLTGETRGLQRATIDTFKIFTIKDYQATNKYLKDNFDTEILKEAGIVNEKGHLIFYKHKIILPFYSGKKLIFLQGRNIDGTHPKYLNLVGISKPIFNLENLIKLNIGDKIFICEGVFDAMRLVQEGYNAVAILGVTDFRPEEVDLFNGFDVVLALDNDEVGKKMSDEIATLFTLRGKTVKQKILPEGIKDITDYYLATKRVENGGKND